MAGDDGEGEHAGGGGPDGTAKKAEELVARAHGAARGLGSVPRMAAKERQQGAGAGGLRQVTPRVVFPGMCHRGVHGGWDGEAGDATRGAPEVALEQGVRRDGGPGPASEAVPEQSARRSHMTRR